MFKLGISNGEEYDRGGRTQQMQCFGNSAHFIKQTSREPDGRGEHGLSSVWSKMIQEALEPGSAVCRCQVEVNVS